MSRLSSLVSRRSFLVRVVAAVERRRLPGPMSSAPTFRCTNPNWFRKWWASPMAMSRGSKSSSSRQPALAKVSFDWGFGDWETCIDAASHVGNREIAEFLIANGARPTLFTAAMLGQLDVVKAQIAAAPGIQRTPGPHSITLLRHAMAGGPRAQAVVDYLKSIEGADERPTEKPLTPEDVKKLSGAYSFGFTPYSRVEMTANATNQMQFGRPGRFPRGLTHLGVVRVRAEQAPNGCASGSAKRRPA